MDNNHRPQRFHQSRGPPPPLQPQPQPPQAQPQQYDPNLLLLQSMGMGMNLLFPQNQIQNPNSSFPNPNFNNNLNNNFPIYHNHPAFLQHNTPNLSSSPHSFSHNNNNNFINNSTHNQQQQNPNFPLQRNNHSAITADRKVTLDKIEAAIATVRHQFIQAADHISSSKLLQCALVKLQAHSLDSFGFQLHEVPSLHHLTLIEAKINAFIRCYVAAHKIITVFDLQEALCKNEGIQKFEELQLGPFIRHPLVMHYFALTKDVDQVYNISTEEVVNHLSLFLCKKYDKVQIEDFVQFLANHYKVKNPLLLGLRIKSLGMHIGFLQKARKAESIVLKNIAKAMEERLDKPKKKRPLFSLEKKELDDRFSVMTERITDFASGNKDFRGKHIRFDSSSSDEDQGTTDNSDNEETRNDSFTSNQCQSSVKRKSGDRVSSCPYPSVAEEMTRLGLKGEINDHSSPCSESLKSNQKSELPKKKRKLKSQSHGKAIQRGPFLLSGSTEEKDRDDTDNDSIRMFITTWKEACRENSTTEVLVKMLRFYKISGPQRKKITKAFSAHPLVGLLNVAVTSIRRGMWDSMYDKFQFMGELGEANPQANGLTEYESIDIEPIEKDSNLLSRGTSKPASCANMEDIVRKASEYLAESNVFFGGSSLVDRVLMFAKGLSRCEAWLAEQFSVNDFKLLGHGDFFSFLECNISLLPKELLNFIRGEVQKHQLLEVCMIQQQLAMLLSQASSSLWEEDVVTKEKISELLVRQFPLVSFKVIESATTQELLNFVEKHRGRLASNCVIFSASLSGTSTYVDSTGADVNDMCDSSGPITDVAQINGKLGSVTSKDAINILLKAPFLSDLNLWLHWDLVYAPSLGPFLEWLLTEVNVEGLLCLLTRDGKIIRIDHLASGDLFFEALLKENAYQVAVQLLSLFSLSGGKRHVPLSLLKCQARQGFEVIMANFMQNMDYNDGQRNEKAPRENEPLGCRSSTGIVKNFNGVNNAMVLVSRIVIDCLVFLPSEFRCFAADVLLAGLQSLVKDAASAILVQCKGKERLILHEIGFSLGITEWIHDHHSVCPITDFNSLMSSGAPSLTSLRSDVKGFDFAQSSSTISSSAVDKDELCKNDIDTSIPVDSSAAQHSENNLSHHIAEQGIKEAALVIESIRRDEFGLDPNISDMESSLLKKQHARLGRALHCLSEELYSQDSHFLLELVQNADDNIYPENVEPTLTFILHDTGITVLNNERGFTAKNIRALCDVGNSTKKGSSAGYIGQKGIGFKSVFRVTDAPEIHSNGFHMKFDIGQGQIGFVLPTIVPPCDFEMLKRLVPEDDFQKGNCWNTCIVLPFKSKLLVGSALSSVLSMFSDLHPSLLIFLHRLQCIKLRNMINNSLVIMKKEIVGDGIVKVSHGKEEMTWFVASNKLHPKVIRPNVHMTEISMALTLNESVDGDYEPLLAQQPVFAFLPLRTYGLKFILQADFVLPSSREEVDGDSPWNQWLLSEFPALFVGAEKSFCSLSCFRENPAKAVNAYMSFVPLMGEVHGFFSGLPRMIIAKLRQSNCLLQEGCKNKWVPPCKVLRGWNEQAQILLPDTLLYEHLGLGLLHKDVNLSDALARALNIEEYGPKILVQFISSLGRVKDGIKSMGLHWLFSWLNELHIQSYAPNSRISGTEMDLLNSLKKVPFIPLSDGTYSSLDEGTIWFHSDFTSTGLDGELGYEAFPCLYATLRIVSPALFSEACADVALISNCTRMLQTIGVQQMSAHELVRIHVLPSISDDRLTDKSKQLMTEYMAFVMLHLHSNCVDCHIESDYIISELCSKALILTNHGYIRPVEIPIHFSKEFGNFVDANKLISGLDCKWHVVDDMYLKHPITESMPCGLLKWREFFQKLGVTDFVKVVPAEKSVADLSPPMLNQMICDRNLVPPGLVVRDWESPELVHMLSLLSRDGSQERCKYLLETLDLLWDDHYSDKIFGSSSSNSGLNEFSFKSSLWHCISDTRWVISSVDNELHRPSELFYDCDDVRSIFGCHAPYAVPKVKTVKLVTEIGFKTQVTLDDALTMLHTWRTSESTFTASLLQMSKLYSFVWKEMATCRQQVLDTLNSGPFIFIPCASIKLYEDVVAGVFLSPEEVYWDDSTGALDYRKNVEFSPGTSSVALSKTLCSIYPGLRDFFVNKCGVHEAPSFSHYLQILQQLSGNSSPRQAANAVFQVLLKWSHGLKCGALSSDDISYLKECLLQSEFRILPALQDKWVSLHPSFGLVCWSDDDALKKELKHKDNIEFLYFGELMDNEKEMLETNVSVLLQNLGIPAVSKVVSREAIYYGPADCGFKSSMVAWVLPFAQRYLYNLHLERYSQLKQSEGDLHHLKVFVVEKLFYHYVIKRCDYSSKKRTECSSLLQGNILYTTRESDSHSVFMELSRLFFDGAPELHLANFLHMITTMAESGSTEEQMEFFILNSQKMAKLPIEESVWSLSSPLSLLENDEALTGNALLTDTNDQLASKSKKKSTHSSWPPVDWNTAPGFSSSRARGMRTQPVLMDQSGNTESVKGLLEDVMEEEAKVILTEINEDVFIEDAGLIEPDSSFLPLSEDQTDHVCNQPRAIEALADPTNVIVETLCPEEGQSKSRDQHLSNTPGAQEAMRTGRIGELVAFRYFAGKADGKEVNWVNQEKETGLPFDIVIGNEQNREYIEVKASRYAKKDWFVISTREWQFATEKGDSFSIAYVLLSGQNLARIIVYKNPVKLCQLGKLQLTVMIPKSYQEPF
ncbi:protein NO VEIN [Beta vulgaris subsp. vulgaris]|uniref:protein NO VEIN n=1 Tax=Beta vulgaris subsp. vulgaris TaxID=3555 RepID=UPI00203694FF|nr:protein NO VEIN [Beta vulgaris subsp. vulgaris]